MVGQVFASDEARQVVSYSMKSGDGSNNHFNGMPDELRIYNRGLSNDEIRTLFKE
jgi:hypothetical protein